MLCDDSAREYDNADTPPRIHTTLTWAGNQFAVTLKNAIENEWRKGLSLLRTQVLQNAMVKRGYTRREWVLSALTYSSVLSLEVLRWWWIEKPIVTYIYLCTLFDLIGSYPYTLIMVRKVHEWVEEFEVAVKLLRKASVLSQFNSTTGHQRQA